MDLALICNAVGTKFHLMANRSVAASTTLEGGEDGDIGRILACNTSAGKVTLKLPLFTSRIQSGSWFIVFDSNGTAGTNAIEVDPNYASTKYTLNGQKTAGVVVADTYGGALMLYRPLSNTEFTWFSFPFGGNSQVTTAVAISTVSANTTLNSTYRVVIANTSSAAITVSLPNAAKHEGQQFTVKRVGTNGVTLDPYGSDTIDGGTSLTVDNDDDAVTIISDGSDWQILSSYGSTW